MTDEIIWIHDKALNKAHQSLQSASKMVFVWDDQYFRNRSYSLKRLVFIYETLCEMPVQILCGETVSVFKNLAPAKIKTFYTPDTVVKEIINKLSFVSEVDVIKPKPFVEISESLEFKRFFKYWNQAKKTAFLKNGGK